MKESVILFKFASRSRPEKFRKAMESITYNLAQPELACYLFTFDENDPTIEEYKKIVAEYTFKNITEYDIKKSLRIIKANFNILKELKKKIHIYAKPYSLTLSYFCRKGCGLRVIRLQCFSAEES